MQFLVGETERYSSLLGSTLAAKAAELGLNKESLAAASSHEQSIADEFGLGVGILAKTSGRPRRSARSAAAGTAATASDASAVSSPPPPKVRRLTEKEKQDDGDADFDSPENSRYDTSYNGA